MILQVLYRHLYQLLWLSLSIIDSVKISKSAVPIISTPLIFPSEDFNIIGMLARLEVYTGAAVPLMSRKSCRNLQTSVLRTNTGESHWLVTGDQTYGTQNKTLTLYAHYSGKWTNVAG